MSYFSYLSLIVLTKSLTNTSISVSSNVPWKVLTNFTFSTLLSLLLYSKYNPYNEYIFHKKRVLFSSSIVSTKCFLISSKYCPNKICLKYVLLSLSYSMYGQLELSLGFLGRHCLSPNKFRINLTGSITSSFLIFFLPFFKIIWSCNLSNFFSKSMFFIFLLLFQLYALLTITISQVWKMYGRFKAYPSLSFNFFNLSLFFISLSLKFLTAFSNFSSISLNFSKMFLISISLSFNFLKSFLILISFPFNFSNRFLDNVSVSFNCLKSFSCFNNLYN